MTNTELKAKEHPLYIDTLLGDSLLVFDLPSLMEKIKQEDAWQIGERNAITILKSDKLRLVLMALREGSEINFCKSGNLFSLQLLEGKLMFHTENKELILEHGHILTLLENIDHSLVAISESIFLLTIGNGIED
jgi:quercetin dioxygenase-like cupin family protein